MRPTEKDEAELYEASRMLGNSDFLHNRPMLTQVVYSDLISPTARGYFHGYTSAWFDWALTSAKLTGRRF